MNANSTLRTPTINQWLKEASHKLQLAKIDSAVLDSELIIAYVLNKDRAYLRAYPDIILSQPSVRLANCYLKKRLDRQPIAYLTGIKEFYGQQFIVNKSTLIPRPETEAVIESISYIIRQNNQPTKTLVDIGTGSGCIGLTCKLLHPQLEVTLSDISNKALKVARENAINLKADVIIKKSNLFHHINGQFDIIVANLPYVDQDWTTSPELKYEPKSALFASQNGLAIINKLIAQAPRSLSKGGFMVLEADPSQHSRIKLQAKKYGLSFIKQFDYSLIFKLPS